jgi:hypothetical protein
MQDSGVEQRSEIVSPTRKQLVADNATLASENTSLRESVARLMQQQSRTTTLRHAGHRDDFVPLGWVEQHAIEIPRADGLFESAKAWVRISHGVITNAGIKNESILSVMISLRLVDEGEERSARLYTDWKTAFLSSVDPVKWSAEEGRGNPEAWSKEDRYSKLLHRVDQDCLFAMDAIVAEKPKGKHLAAFKNNQPRFIEAIGTVVSSIRDINREAEEASKKNIKPQ